MTPSDCAALLDGRTLGRRYAPAPTTPATTGRLAASALATQAQRIAARSDLAHRPAGLQPALRAWGRACDVEIRAGRALPEWPRWQGVPRSPWDLMVLLARVDGTYTAGDVAQLAADVEVWAARWERMWEGVTT